LSETEPQENPLVNNKKLRQMYLAMIEARMLDEHIAKLQRKAKTRINSTRGQEACRVSTAIELVEGDLVSDSQAGVVMDYILGAESSAVRKRLSHPLARGKTVETTGAKQLPWIEDVDDRLRVALGAALAFKSLKQTNLVVAYIPRREARGGSWRKLLMLTAQLELPIILVVLPHETASRKADPIGRISAKARSCKLPGIPVDASDAVALYRVAQESIGRIRSGGGAVVIECVSLPVRGKVPDPVEQMKAFLLEKKACTSAWMEHAGDSFRERVSAKKK
jgi:acetoin:2,6-dichlorophenolindophenol oxidoreductase subunit alpha